MLKIHCSKGCSGQGNEPFLLNSPGLSEPVDKPLGFLNGFGFPEKRSSCIKSGKKKINEILNLRTILENIENHPPGPGFPDGNFHPPELFQEILLCRGDMQIFIKSDNRGKP
jgi:hypothetical protein